jgi:hypothetical protein
MEGLITPGHETKEANVRTIVYIGIGFAVIIAIGFFAVYGMFGFLSSHPFDAPQSNPMAKTGVRQFPPLPRIEEHPALELIELHKQEDRLLSTYGWTDKQAGVVRIPVERAIELQLQRGYPERKEAPKK